MLTQRLSKGKLNPEDLARQLEEELLKEGRQNVDQLIQQQKEANLEKKAALEREIDQV